MRRNIVKLISLIAVMTLVMPLAGCFLEEFYIEPETSTTSSSSGSFTFTTNPYIRTNFDTVKNPYFAMLSDKEKDAYSNIYEELLAGNSKFESKVSLNGDELTKAIDAVLYDHPELFWLDNTYGYTYDPNTGDIKEVSFDFFDFADTPEKLESAKIQFNTAVDLIVAKALSYSTVVERELYIHDYICENTVYDDSAKYNQSAYSVIVLHQSVCAGYTRAFQYLMQKTGATCYYVTGRTDGLNNSQTVGSGDGSHSWNMILIEGGYYNVDCLWDDTASETYGSSIYPFFNLTDDAFIYHARIDMAFNLPSCTATDYKYSNQFGSTIEADSLIFEDAA